MATGPWITHSNARASREFHHGCVAAVVAALRVSLPRLGAHTVCGGVYGEVGGQKMQAVQEASSVGVGVAKRQTESVKCTRRLEG